MQPFHDDKKKSTLSSSSSSSANEPLVFQIHRANIFLTLCIFGEIQQNGMLAMLAAPRRFDAPTIGGSKRGRQGRASPLGGSNSFIFMQFSAKN